MAAIAGLRGTGDWGTDERPKNFREMILWLQPNGQTPLTALMSRMKTASTNDPEFSWWEERLQTMRFQVDTTGGLSTSTIIGLSVTTYMGANNLKPGDVLLIEKADQVTYDNEIVIVSSVTSDTQITIVRGAAGTTAAAIPASSMMTRIGSTYAEGTSAPSATSRNPTKLTNLCQIFKDAYEITNTTAKTRARTGDPKANDKKRKMFDHSVALEWAFLLGKKYETVGANNKPQRFVGGLRSFLATNVTVFTTTPTINTFVDAIAPVFNWTSSDAGGERIVLCGNGALNSLNKMIAGTSNVGIRYGGTIDQYRMRLHVFETPQGIVYLKSHPLLSQHSLYKNSMFIIDPTNIRYRPLRDTDFKDNIQPPDADSQKGQWITEAGMEVNHEETMGYIGNFVV